VECLFNVLLLWERRRRRAGHLLECFSLIAGFKREDGGDSFGVLLCVIISLALQFVVLNF